MSQITLPGTKPKPVGVGILSALVSLQMEYNEDIGRYAIMKKVIFVLLLLLVTVSYVTPIVSQSDSFIGYGDDGKDYYDDMRDYRPAPTLSPAGVEYVNRQNAKIIMPILAVIVLVCFFKIIEWIVWAIKNNKPGSHW